MRAVRLTVALPAAAAGDPRLRPGRDPRLRRLAGAARRNQPRHLPRLLHLRRPARRRRRASSPACWRSASRRAPGSSGSSSCSTSHPAIAGRARRGRAAAAARRDRLRRRRTSATTSAASVLDGLRPRSRRRASGWRSSARAAAARRPRRCSSRASTSPTAARCWSTATTCAGVDAALAAPPGRRRLRGELPLLRQRRARTSPTGGRGRATRRSRRRRGSPQADGFIARAAARLRQRRRRARADPLGRAAPADRAGAGDAAGPADPDPRRRDQRGRRRAPRRRSTTGLRDGAGRPHDAARRPPALDPPPRRPRSSSSTTGGSIDEGTHEELTERSALYRGLLTGLDEDVAEAVEGRVEALSARVGADDRGGLERRRGARSAPAPTARPRSTARRAEPRRRARQSRRRRAAARWRKSLAPTPQLLARVGDAAAGPRRGRRRPRPRVPPRSAASACASCCASSAGRCCVGLVLVILDALAGLAGPVLVKNGIDNGVATGSQAALFVASAIFLVVTLADLVDEVGETFVTGRTAQRVMLSLRIRIWAQLQRLVARLLRARDGRPDHDPDDDRRRPVRSR